MKLVTGNPGKRALNKKRAVAPAGNLILPDYFSEEQAAIWHESIANAPKSVLRPADRELLIAFCEQVAIKRQAQRELKQAALDGAKADGSTTFLSVETERGWVKNPLITVVDTAVKNIRYLASELGLSPASRERLGSQDEDETANPWAQFKKNPSTDNHA